MKNEPDIFEKYPKKKTDVWEEESVIGDYVTTGAMMLFAISFLLVMFSIDYVKTEANKPKTNEMINAFDSDETLEYDEDTKIVYYRTSYKMCPYYSENGKLCRYVDGEIIEIDDGR